MCYEWKYEWYCVWERSQFYVLNDIMNDIVNNKKGYYIVNDSFAHKSDGLLIIYWCATLVLSNWANQTNLKKESIMTPKLYANKWIEYIF